MRVLFTFCRQGLIMLYYPCIFDPHLNRISKIVGGKTTLAKAIEELKSNYYSYWRVGEALAQPVNHPYFVSKKCSECHQPVDYHKMDCSHRHI